jgi:WD40 repeat protein
MANDMPMEFFADGTKLVTFSFSDVMFHEWDLTTGLEIRSWPGPPAFNGTVALSPDERFFVSSGLEGDTISRNLVDESSVTLPLDILEVYSHAAAFSPDGKLFAIASNVNYARVWDAKTWQEVVTLHGGGVSGAAFSPDGRRLAISGDASSQALELWDTESWQNVATLRASGNIFEGSFSPDGNSVSVMSRAGILHVWRAPSWTEINVAEAQDKTEAQ